MMIKRFIPVSFSMWGISKDELEEMLENCPVTSEEKQSILDEYDKMEE